jgi:CRP/FNR family transcriptional regulator, anaerobic regulatory protein
MSEAVLALQPYSERVTVAPNTKIVTEGDDANHAYIIERGFVRLCTRTTKGSPFIADFMVPSDIFGVIEQDLYLWTAEAVTEVHLLRMSKTQAGNLLHPSAKSNGLVAHAWQTAADAWRFHRAVPGQSPKQRLASFLIRLSQRTNTPIGQPILVPMGLNDIACHTELHPADLTAAWSDLARQQVIEIRKAGSCTILNATAVLELAVPAAAPGKTR